MRILVPSFVMCLFSPAVLILSKDGLSISWNCKCIMHAAALLIGLDFFLLLWGFGIILSLLQELLWRLQCLVPSKGHLRLLGGEQSVILSGSWICASAKLLLFLVNEWNDHFICIS